MQISSELQALGTNLRYRVGAIALARVRSQGPHIVGNTRGALNEWQVVGGNYDDGHERDGDRRDGGNGHLSPRHIHLRGAWNSGSHQIPTVLVVRWRAYRPTDCGPEATAAAAEAEAAHRSLYSSG